MIKNRLWSLVISILLAFVIPAIAVDTDSDGLDDTVETDTGFYLSAADTGTDPLESDTDGDGVMDGAEVNSGAHPLDQTITPFSWQIGSDIRITDFIDSSQVPRIVWTGSEYGIVWYDLRDDLDGVCDGNECNYEIYFARIDGSGRKIGNDLRVTNEISYGLNASIIWTGSEYGVSWQDFRDGNWEIYFAHISALGIKVGSDARVTNATDSSEFPSIVWTGSEYGISWMDFRGGNWEIYFARVDLTGSRLGPDVRITNDANSSRTPSLVWTGSEYGIVWHDLRDDLDGVCDGSECNYEIYFTRIDAAGAQIGPDLRITNDVNVSSSSSLVWTGSEYGVAWQDNRDGNNEIYFTFIDATGTKTSADIRITNDANASIGPSLAWEGFHYGVSWDDNRDGNKEIYFTRIDPSGTKIGPDLRITDDPNVSYNVSLAWTGYEYGAVWQDNRDGNIEIYFARINVDEDGDGLDNAIEAVLGFDPANWDSDADGVSDREEIGNSSSTPGAAASGGGGGSSGGCAIAGQGSASGLTGYILPLAFALAAIRLWPRRKMSRSRPFK